MTKVQALQWVSTLIQDMPTQPSKRLPSGSAHYERIEAVEETLLAWFAEASHFIESYFPRESSIGSRWREASTWKVIGGWHPHPIGDVRHHLKAVLEAAGKLIADDRLTSFESQIQASTVTELLDQAKALLVGGHIVAATVLAGGALETHLMHLCHRAKIVPSGNGSISKYKQELDRARTSGNEIVSATDCKQIEGWGGRRNDAAHNPTSYDATVPEVSLMIQGIELFVSKYP